MFSLKIPLRAASQLHQDALLPHMGEAFPPPPLYFLSSFWHTAYATVCMRHVHLTHGTNFKSTRPECGLLTLIGATTENPSFALNKALLSRCRVLVFEKLTADDIRAVICYTSCFNCCGKLGSEVGKLTADDIRAAIVRIDHFVIVIVGDLGGR